MREGAWINIATGKFEWITEHCDWIKLPQNAAKIGQVDLRSCLARSPLADRIPGVLREAHAAFCEVPLKRLSQG